MSSPRGFIIDGEEVEAFGWPERFVVEARDRRFLMTWARCMATGASASERYRALGWERSTVERRRRAALAAIAAGLNRQGSTGPRGHHDHDRAVEGWPARLAEGVCFREYPFSEVI